MEASFTAERHVGNLVEARVRRLETPFDVTLYEGVFPKLLRGVKEPILCADHRPVVIYPQDVADRLARIFTNFNRKWGRVAILASRSNASLVLQLTRLIREANNPSRKLCFSADEAIAFLDDALDAAERARLRAFLEG